MYVTIDKERLVFLRKHEDNNVLANVAWIESHDVPIALVPADSVKSFTTFSELELKTLYSNTTGHEFTGKYGALVQIMADIARRLPDDEINAFEADTQAAAVKEDSDKHYKFVPGSVSPGRVRGLFEGKAKKVARCENAELMAIAGKLPPPKGDLPNTPEATETGVTEITAKKPAKKKAAAKKKPAAKKAPADDSERPTQNGVRRPGAGTKTCAVWDILDEHYTEGEPIMTSKELKAITGPLEMNPNMVSANYSVWKKFHGLTKPRNG